MGEMCSIPQIWVSGVNTCCSSLDGGYSRVWSLGKSRDPHTHTALHSSTLRIFDEFILSDTGEESDWMNEHYGYSSWPPFVHDILSFDGDFTLSIPWCSTCFYQLDVHSYDVMSMIMTSTSGCDLLHFASYESLVHKEPQESKWGSLFTIN